MRNQKSTNEIRNLLFTADLDYDSVVNQALNAYLSKIFLSCPFTDEPCTKKQCTNCDTSRNHITTKAKGA